MQYQENQEDTNSGLSFITKALPLLPKLIRYFDDFEDKLQSIRNLHEDEWTVFVDGKKISLKFTLVPDNARIVLKHIALDMFTRLDPTSVCLFLSQLLRRPHPLIIAIQAMPSAFRIYWDQQVLSWSHIEALALRVAVHSLCRLGVGRWEQELRSFVSSLPSPKLDIYKSVRQQECFLPMSHQSLIIDYLDELTFQVKSTTAHDVTRLRAACLLILCHQFGFRPGQIARIRTSDIRTYSSEVFHFAIPLGKQRGSEKMRLITRRIKADWAPIFLAYVDAVLQAGINSKTPAHLFFRMTPSEVSLSIIDLAEKITGERWTPTDFRHSAAQRLADAGISHVSLSEFMGHTTTQVATVYYDASPAQAQLINQALALSPIYANVATVAKTQFIDKVALLKLPQSHHIGGVPHGIPIAGIGGCSMGQSICTKNPVLSCYTCRKFLPLSDAEIHESVVASLQPVVIQFAQASRHHEETPAYTQLRRMLESASQVVTDIRSMQGVEMKRPE
ncbi:MAG: site-specific integrase [Cyanobacteria bacterium PR.023]|nr:site-specific integrase [Cyanobacteria bacterium PR.023]